MTEKVGYGSPPHHTKWQKGQSGNPSGRKKGKRNLKSDLEDELSETIHINEGGKRRRITKQRAFIKRLTAKAIEGDVRSIALLSNLATRLADPDGDTVGADQLSPEERQLFETYFPQPTTKNGGA